MTYAEYLKIKKLTSAARAYLQEHYTDPAAPAELKCDVHYSIDSVDVGSLFDKYDEALIDALMKNSSGLDMLAFDKALKAVMDQTFTDKLLAIVNAKGLKNTEVYEAAQIDRRLYSKIMSERSYQPSKDTALALAFGLELTLQEAKDLLSRAGYTLSHSNKRDVILEYFFREEFYNLTEINIVLDDLGQKIIGKG